MSETAFPAFLPVAPVMPHPSPPVSAEGPAETTLFSGLLKAVSTTASADADGGPTADGAAATTTRRTGVFAAFALLTEEVLPAGAPTPAPQTAGETLADTLVPGGAAGSGESEGEGEGEGEGEEISSLFAGLKAGATDAAETIAPPVGDPETEAADVQGATDGVRADGVDETAAVIPQVQTSPPPAQPVYPAAGLEAGEPIDESTVAVPPAGTAVTGTPSGGAASGAYSSAAEAFAAALLGALEEVTKAVPDPETIDETGDETTGDQDGTPTPAGASTATGSATAVTATLPGEASAAAAPDPADAPVTAALSHAPPSASGIPSADADLAALLAALQLAGTDETDGRTSPPATPSGPATATGTPASDAPGRPAVDQPAVPPGLTRAATEVAEALARLAAKSGAEITVTTTPATPATAAEVQPATVQQPVESDPTGEPAVVEAVAQAAVKSPSSADGQAQAAGGPFATLPTPGAPAGAGPAGMTPDTAAAAATVFAPEADPVVEAAELSAETGPEAAEPGEPDALAALDASDDGLGTSDDGGDGAGDPEPGPEAKADAKEPAAPDAEPFLVDPGRQDMAAQRTASPLAAAALAFAARLKGEPMGLDRAEANQAGLTPLSGAPGLHAGQSAAPAMGSAFMPSQPTVPMGQLGMEIARQALAGETSFQIRLDPADLGRVDVRLELSESGEAKAHLTVERRDTLDLLSRDQRALERALREAGFEAKDGSVSLSLRQNGSGDGQARHGQPDEPPNGRGRSGWTSDDTGSDERSARPALDLYRPRRDSLLDVRI
ncbi:flagellar hook-length control protein FliK [Chthonobacter rhizosphaerae]|uniref:flagellar hook-length control protein FliK n=1 Tax=Chthonobacter rhizosphaerae TaxID=2735553 RepID=UPI0015EEA9D7|nr:flagellar hook-length control protein FliK [Chthonobacter rhizosphaerae]